MAATTTSYNQATNTFTINGTNGNDNIQIYRDFQGHNWFRVGEGSPQFIPDGVNVKINGLKGNDVINAAHSGLAHLEVDGGKGNDTIVGSFGHDTLNGGKGNDVIYGLGGNDYINGGKGADKVYGGWGNDQLYGGKGNDYLSGGFGSDYLNGGKGANTLLDVPGNYLNPWGMGMSSAYYGNNGFHYTQPGQYSWWNQPQQNQPQYYY